MSQINDSVTVIAGTAHNDSEHAFYKSKGMSSPCLQDAEHEYLIPLSGGIPTQGPNQDMWFKFLRSSGYTGALSDMKAAFWAAQPALP